MMEWLLFLALLIVAHAIIAAVDGYVNRIDRSE